MLLVRHLLAERPEPHVLNMDQTVRDAAVWLREKRIGGAPVVADGRLVGFCSERDLVFRALAVGLNADWTRVAEVMTQFVVTAAPDDTIATCEEKLRAAHCRHLPIVDRGRVVGCLSLRDFLQSDLLEREQQLHALSEYVRSAGA